MAHMLIATAGKSASPFIHFYLRLASRCALSLWPFRPPQKSIRPSVSTQWKAPVASFPGIAELNRLHGPPKKNKRLRRDGLKGLQPYIRAVDAVVAAAHDGYSRLGFLSPGCTQGTGDSSEFPNPV